MLRSQSSFSHLQFLIIFPELCAGRNKTKVSWMNRQTQELDVSSAKPVAVIHGPPNFKLIRANPTGVPPFRTNNVLRIVAT